MKLSAPIRFPAIPAEIAAMPGLRLLERMALAHIAGRPGCTNAELATLVGLSLRGAEEMMRRLRLAGHIEVSGKGRARQLHLQIPAEHHSECEVTPTPEIPSEGCEDSSPSSEAPSPDIAQPQLVARDTTGTVEFVLLHQTLAEDCIIAGDFDGGLAHLGRCRQRVEDDLTLDELDKASALIHLASEYEHVASLKRRHHGDTVR